MEGEDLGKCVEGYNFIMKNCYILYNTPTSIGIKQKPLRTPVTHQNSFVIPVPDSKVLIK